MSPLAAQGSIVGDYDNNGTVDGNDFLVWQRGQSPNGIDSGDLEDWKANYGQPLPAATISAVPEPGCLVLTSAAALLAIAGGRRRL